jgi:hypothetical protein
MFSPKNIKLATFQMGNIDIIHYGRVVYKIAIPINKFLRIKSILSKKRNFIYTSLFYINDSIDIIRVDIYSCISPSIINTIVKGINH